MKDIYKHPPTPEAIERSRTVASSVQYVQEVARRSGVVINDLVVASAVQTVRAAEKAMATEQAPEDGDPAVVAGPAMRGQVEFSEAAGK